MSHRMLGLSAVVSVFLLAAACGDDDDAAPAKFPTSDSFCTALATKECEAVAAVCTVSEDTCKTARKNACNATAQAATAQGREYRSGNAETCIDKTAALYADRVLSPAKEEDFREACARVFTGAKKQSETCNNPYDCEGSLVCDKGFCASEVTKRDNEACNNPGDVCDKGFFCQDRGGGSKFCTAKGALSASCRIPDSPCAEDLRCNGTSCVALLQAGQPCDTNDECSTKFCNAERKCQAAQYASETRTCKDFGGN